MWEHIGGLSIFNSLGQGESTTTTTQQGHNIMTENFSTASADFHESEVISFMAIPYDIPKELLFETWTKIKADPKHEIRESGRLLLPSDAKGELQSRLDDPEVDDLENARPEAHKAGWLSACVKISAVDAAWSAVPDDAPEEDFPPNVGSLLKYAENEVNRLRQERKLAYLIRSEWTDESRCELWTWRGREDCCWSCCRLLDIDNDIPSIDLAKILRKHNSSAKAKQFAIDLRQDRYIESRSVVTELIQEYSQWHRAVDVLQSIVDQKRGA